MVPLSRTTVSLEKRRSRPKAVRRAFLLLTILLLASFPLQSSIENVQEEEGIEWLRFDLPKDTIRNLVGEMEATLSLEERPLLAHSRLGIHDANGVLFEHDIPDELLVSRPDLALVLVDTEMRFSEVRNALEDMQGIEVREYISPSGLLIQGTQIGLSQLEGFQGVASVQPVPLAMVVDFTMFEAEVDSMVRIESWRAETLLPGVDIVDRYNIRLHQEIAMVAEIHLEEYHLAETGRFDGTTVSSIAKIAAEPSVSWVGIQPSLTIWNDQSRNHMNINAMRSYYTTDLDGSGQIVGVADSGLDHDHGDFGNRVIGNVDVIGDGSTADAHSGHGTHVACTVLGDGTRGGYAGVAPEAELYFQAMENDNNGNFQWSSINNMLNSAYSNGARTHTNSWGSESSSEWGVYTSSSEDVDDRARYYDQYYSGREGLTVLFAAGNDGPQSDTIGSPATAKNLIAVGNSQNRYQGAPNSIMDGSSRGPVDDGRIKPDLLAPGGYVRSCKAQEATDTGGSTWSNSWYLEYTGTSMATPNAAGTAALIREYITEVAQRPEPQGALVKALMILGARDVGSRDIPNMNEGWGRIDLKSTLAPNNGRGIWVDDRSVLSSTGNSKSYSFNITTANQPFKVVVAWSDERGSRFSNSQLVNDLDLLVTTPSGVEYLGNEFAQGRSIQGGTHDDVNNVEVVLIDSAEAGLWTVRVRDAGHGGGRAQPFAIAVSGVGVNDLRPDPSPIPNSLATDISIPQVGDDVLVEMGITNLGNVKAEDVEVIFQEEGVYLDTQTITLGPGGSKTLFWDWNPQTAGSRTLSFIVDSTDAIDEINEDNNRLDVVVDVTTPGVRITSQAATTVLPDIEVTTSSWQVTLTNTALLSTNASISSTGVTSPTGSSLNWYVGLDDTDFQLDGQEGASINVTLVHPAGPDPGLYEIDLLGFDEDNSVSSPFTLILDVPVLSDTTVEFDYTVIPVHPSEVTSIDIRLFNQGNDDIGYDVFLESPPGWFSGFDDLSAQGGANSGSTGLMLEDGQMNIGISFTPPQVMTRAGTELTVVLKVISQSDDARMETFELPLVVMEIKSVIIDLETSITSVLPGSTITLQYSIENRGNVDIDLTPRLDLPNGWIQNTILDSISLAWTQSENLLISVSTENDAKSGTIRMTMDSNAQSWTHEEVVDVTQLAEPVVTFASLEIEGETWGQIFGPGSHPVGVAMNYTWLVENLADTTWSPQVILSADSNLIGECSSIGSVSKGDIVPLTCTVLISANANPGDEPSFTVIIEEDTIRHEELVTMLVAEEKKVSWDVEDSLIVNVGEESVIDITITNTGNSIVSSLVNVKPPSGWSSSFEGGDTVDLEAGESEKLRLKIIANKPGSGELEFTLAGADDVEGATYSVMLEAEGDAVQEESNSLTVVFSSIAIGILVLGLVAFALTRRVNEPESPKLAPSAAAFQTPTAQTNATPCFSCRQPILSMMQACPSCGARYHAVCKVSKCVNCSADSSTFVNVE